jgi:pimeloyl-ACP methyl ester carboxylesterase
MASKRIVLALFALFALSSGAAAQDTPIVFVHGFNGDQNTWQATAARLQQQLAIRPYVARLHWQEPFETQAAELQSQFGSLPASSVAVGHSNGGLVSRQWSRQHPLSGLLTVGTPNRGAPVVDHLHDILRFNESLYNMVGLAGGAFSIDPATWNFVYVAVRAALLFSQQIALDTVFGTIGLGLHYGAPVTGQMSTSSSFIGQLNSTANVSREQTSIAHRVGLTYVARNYWQAGPARAFDPDNADTYYSYMWASIYLMEAAAGVLSTNYPTNATAMWIANALYKVAGAVRQVDPVWCWAVTNDFSCNTWHDGIVPTTSQALPAGQNLVVPGPAHTQEAKESGPVQYALTSFMNVRLRGGGGEFPPGSGESDELGPGQTLFAGQNRTSGDGRFELAFQGDGNLVLYRNADGTPLWASHTYAPGGEAAMQADGNLVVYDANGVPRWSTGTANHPGARLFVQNDGNVVIYDYYGYPIWATGTAQ